MQLKKIMSVVLLLAVFTFSCSFSNISYSKYGDENINIKNLQTKLILLGYLNAKPSGKFLSQTKEAISQFQKARHLESSGLLNEETLNALNSEEFKPITSTSNEFAIMIVQEKLYDFGFLKTKATGNFKNNTKLALKKFQASKSLEQSGIADVPTLKLLFSVPSEEEVISVSDGRSYEVKNEIFSKLLKRATEGENVRKVQTRLKELQFFDGPISGYYMNQTVSAIKNFQEHNGIKPNGITDEKTWNKLFNDETVVDANATPAPTSEPELPKYHVVVDVTNQAVLVYEKDKKNEYTHLVKTMICSTGTKSTPSDIGDWEFNGRRARWCYFPAYGSHAKYWTQINKYIAFHSVIYNQVDNMALSVSSYKHLGSRASHGCVRLTVNDSKWLFDNMEKGTIISIRDDLPPDEELKMAVKQPPLDTSVMLPVPTPQPTPTPNVNLNQYPSFDFRDLKVKDSGEDVFWLQTALKDMGYYGGTITGAYYSGTSNAIKEFQKAKGLSSNGKADVELQKLIYQELANSTNVDIVSTPTPEVLIATPIP